MLGDCLCHVHKQRSFSKRFCPQHPRETGQGCASLGCCISASAELRPGISSTADGRGAPVNPHGPAITPAMGTGAFYRAPKSSLIPQLTKQRCQIQLQTIPGDQNTQPHRQPKKKGSENILLLWHIAIFCVPYLMLTAHCSTNCHPLRVCTGEGNV